MITFRKITELNTQDRDGLRTAYMVSLDSDCLSSKVGAATEVLGKWYRAYNHHPYKNNSPSCRHLGACPETHDGKCTNTVHAEIAILHQIEKAYLSTVYITREPCYSCVNALALWGADKIIALDGKLNVEGRKAIERNGIELIVVTNWGEFVGYDMP